MTQTQSAPKRPPAIAPPRVENPHYEGVPDDALLPARGEEVWVDHPIFTNDPMLADAVIGTGFDLALETKNGGDPDEIEVLSGWIHGRTPIPLKDLDNLLLTRAFYATGESTPFDSLPPVRSTADSEGLLFDSIAVPAIAEPHYEGCDPNELLPPSREDVWVDHPAFKRCPLFAKDIAIKRSKATDPAELDWLEGRKPIPADTLDRLVATRDKAAAYVGLRITPARAAA